MIKFRRSTLPSIALILVMALGTFTASVPLTGCTYSTAQVQADANAVATACHQIANVLMASDPSLADKINMAATALSSAAANWNVGTVTDAINTAANMVEIALAAIPITAPYAALVGIAVAALDVLLANLPQNAVKAMALPQERANPYRNRVKIQHRILRGPAADLRAAWNAEVRNHPGFAPIR